MTSTEESLSMCYQVIGELSMIGALVKCGTQQSSASAAAGDAVAVTDGPR